MAKLIPGCQPIESCAHKGIVSAQDQISLWRNYVFFNIDGMEGFAMADPKAPKGIRAVCKRAFDAAFSGPHYHIGWGLGDAGAEFTTTASEAFLKSRLVNFGRYIHGITPPPILEMPS